MISLPAQRALSEGYPRLADVAVEVPSVRVGDTVAAADRLFSDDPSLSALVVEGGPGPQLLPRQHLSWVLSGRYGYGRSLHGRSPVREVLPPAERPFRGDLAVATAAELVLQRPLSRRYDDLLVLTADGARVASVAALLEHVSVMFRHIAFHDPLTGLPNRLMLEERGRAFRGSGFHGVVAACYVDLDGFKTVNDTFGHRVGDKVLAIFADRLRHCVRPDDLVARLGGDEFVVMIDASGESLADDVAHRIMDLGRTPFLVDGHVIHLSVSVGIAQLSTGTVGEADLTGLDILLRDSDAAMLLAKRAGKNRLCRLPGSAAGADSPLARPTRIRQRLGQALADGSFELHYQPKLDLATGRVDAVEALLRWNDELLGAVSPVEFIPIAEASGQIVRLGAWVLDQACRQARAWADERRRCTVAINVSPVQFRSATFVDDVIATLSRHGVPTTDIRIEITESSALTDLANTLLQLGRLHEAGIAVDLDDFGTGYSSLAMLRDLPLSSVKLDRQFIDRLETSQADEFLIRGVIETAHALGMSVTAEGVERDGQLWRLRALGCDTVQGFLTGRPVPGRDVQVTSMPPEPARDLEPDCLAVSDRA